MLRDFQNLGLRTIGAEQVLLALTVSFACGLLISAFYRLSYRGSSYSPSFVRSMIFLSMITAIVMMVIGNNLARAFGLVGAMSIIRFRTAVKDPQDIVFIFFSLAVGLAAGVEMYMVALVGTLAIGVVILVTSRANYASVNRESYLLQLSYDAPQQNGSASYLPVIDRYYKRHRLINVKNVGSGNRLDLTFYVDLRNKKHTELLTRELGRARHVSNVNLFYDEEQL
jgi:uncharacterized membrane protein YhiD involved in acid resistance